jgi:hypothetical protein
MDLLALTTIRNSFSSASQWNEFYKMFSLFSPLDPGGTIRMAFDVLRKGYKSPIHPLGVVYSCEFGGAEADTDFEIVAALAAAILSKRYRGDFIVRQRLNWDIHVKVLQHEGQFKKMYRMSLFSFNKLKNMLLPWLQVNEKQSNNASLGNRPIVAEIMLHCTLHYLGGGSYHDIRVSVGLSTAAFYRAVWRGIDAINSCLALQIKFPIMLEDLTKAAHEFECRTSHGIMKGCVAALDGWLCQIHVPTTDEVKKVKPYFSGHYQCYGLNVQATCYADCRFTSLSVLCPGSTSDNKA